MKVSFSLINVNLQAIFVKFCQHYFLVFAIYPEDIV